MLDLLKRIALLADANAALYDAVKIDKDIVPQQFIDLASPRVVPRHKVADRFLLVVCVMIDMKAVVVLPTGVHPIDKGFECLFLLSSVVCPEVNELQLAILSSDRIPEKILKAAVERKAFHIEENIVRAWLRKRVKALRRTVRSLRKELVKRRRVHVRLTKLLRRALKARLRRKFLYRRRRHICDRALEFRQLPKCLNTAFVQLLDLAARNARDKAKMIAFPQHLIDIFLPNAVVFREFRFRARRNIAGKVIVKLKEPCFQVLVVMSKILEREFDPLRFCPSFFGGPRIIPKFREGSSPVVSANISVYAHSWSMKYGRGVRASFVSQIW